MDSVMTAGRHIHKNDGHVIKIKKVEEKKKEEEDLFIYLSKSIM
jgi:hypothetical protein